jgi:hypothetical protein
VSFFVANEADIICYNCAKPGHKANACPAPRRSREERNAVKAKLMAVQPRSDAHPNSEFLEDHELCKAAWSIDFESAEAIDDAVEDLGMEAVQACHSFQEYAHVMQTAASHADSKWR